MQNRHYLPSMAIICFLVGCQEQQPTLPNNQDNTVQIVLDQQNANAVSLSQSTQPANDNQIQKHLETSYARVSARQNDVCPKLVDFQVGQQSVVRKGEKLNGQNYCEYFIFLNQGDSLSVETSDQIQADLVAPEWQNLNYGKFIAKKFDRYTLRLSYDGTRYRPQNLIYDVTIHKNVDGN